MSRGGKRSGAGRKQGSKSKTTIERELKAAALARNAADTGILPLDYMLGVMRDTDVDRDRRDEMAKASAPYIHAKLAAVEHSGSIGTHETGLEELDDHA